ncbi:MAG: hypothetical protein PVI99_08420 [Anaerolineales bacterium]
MLKKKYKLSGYGEVFSKVDFLSEVEYSLLIFETPSGEEEITGFIKVLDNFVGFTKPYPELALVLSDGRRLHITIPDTHHKIVNPTYKIIPIPPGNLIPKDD